MPSRPTASSATVYSPTARRFHWWTAAFVLVMVPLGLYMTYRAELTKFDATTGQLYSLHKGLGFLLLLIVLARLTYRLRNGAPADEPTLEPWHRATSHLTHWALYALLVAVPIGGWLGVSLYGARGIWGPIALPQIAPENQDLAAIVFEAHKLGGWLIGTLVVVHVGAALYHHLIRRDGVLHRMLPGKAS